MFKPTLRTSVLASSLILAGSLVGCGVDTTLDTAGFAQAPQGLTVGQMAVRTHSFGYNLGRAQMMRQFPVRLAAPGWQGPASVDLRSNCGPVEDQGQLGSCTSFAGAGYREYMENVNHESFVPLAELFLYYNERVEENSVNEDSGATIADCMNSLKNTGIAPSQDDPYDISKFTVKPSAQAYTDAGKYKISSFANVQSLADVKAALAGGHPVDIGFKVYESFQNIGSNGVMPMPKRGEGLLGGHSVDVVGYDDSKQQLIVKNSWGTGWGDRGYFYMPYAFYTSANVMEAAIAQ